MRVMNFVFADTWSRVVSGRALMSFAGFGNGSLDVPLRSAVLGDVIAGPADVIFRFRDRTTRRKLVRGIDA